jgi:hypothetical protein
MRPGRSQAIIEKSMVAKYSNRKESDGFREDHDIKDERCRFPESCEGAYAQNAAKPSSYALQG